MQWEAATPVGFPVCARQLDKTEIFCVSRPTRMLKKSVLASGRAKWHFSTIGVCHPSLTHDFEYTFSSVCKQGKSTQSCCWQRRQTVSVYGVTLLVVWQYSDSVTDQLHCIPFA